ncbi:MAG: hypothetical protein WC294_08035 [Methanoregula sp.]|jgi:hypothetical protein
MQLRIILALLILLLPVSGYADKYIRPSADCTYNGNGNSWGCAASDGAEGAYKGFPVNASDILLLTASGIPKGTTAWLAGSDNAYNYMRITNTNSAGEEDRIIFKVATAGAHGTDTGWEESFGTKDVLLYGGIACNATLTNTSGYVTFDGVSRTTGTTGHRLKFDTLQGTFTTSGSAGSGYCQEVIIQYAKFQGYDGYIPDGCRDADPATCGTGIVLSGLSSTVRSKNITIQYCYIVDTFSPVNVSNTEGVTIRGNYIVRNESTSTSHSNAVSSPGRATGLLIERNWVEDIQGTGWFSMLGGAAFDEIHIRNNILVNKNTNPENPIGVGHGPFTTNIFYNRITNFTYYNNDHIGFQYDSPYCRIWFRGGCAGNCDIKNNLWYCAAGESCGVGTVVYPSDTILHFDTAASTDPPTWEDNNSALTCTNGTASVPSCASSTTCLDGTIGIGGGLGSIRIVSTTGTFSIGDTCTTAGGKDFVIAGVSVPANVTSTNNYYYGNTGNPGETGSKYPVSNENPFVDYSNYDFRLARNGNSALGTGADLSSVFTNDYNGNTRTSWDMGALNRIGGNQTIGTGAGFSLGVGAAINLQ